MTEATKQSEFDYIGADGGTEEYVYGDLISANAGVTPENKRRAYYLLGAAGVTCALLFISRLIWLFEPVLDLIYYGTLSEIVYYIILGLLFTGYIIGLNVFIKRKTGVRLFALKKTPVSPLRALSVIAVGAVFVLIVNAALDFKLKIEFEMGMGVTMAQALTNIAVYFYYAFHMWLGFTAAALVQYGMSMLFPAKYTFPWGSIFLVLVYGLIEFVLEATTTDHLLPGYYFLFTFAYAIIFSLTGRRFHLSYWASVIIMVL